MRYFIFTALIGLVAISASSVRARENGDLYISGSLGVVFPQDVDIGSDQIKTDEGGFHIEAGFGGYISPRFRWELANGYRRYEAKDKSSDGTFGAYSILANGYFNPIGQIDRHEPYLGFGAGFGIWDLDDGNPATDPKTAFMLNAMAGYHYHFSDNLAFGVSYRFGYSEPESLTGSFTNYKHRNHSVLLTVSYFFTD